ncbi:MAG: hypothetical protein AAAB35_18785 [Phyllobacterium sp.]
MTYYTEESRGPMKTELNDFYDKGAASSNAPDPARTNVVSLQ